LSFFFIIISVSVAPFHRSSKKLSLIFWFLCTQEQSSSQSQETLTPNQIEILKAFRAELEEEGHLKPTETLGTDDETLMLGYFVFVFFFNNGPFEKNDDNSN
jgi:hypothetical protein